MVWNQFPWMIIYSYDHLLPPPILHLEEDQSPPWLISLCKNLRPDFTLDLLTSKMVMLDSRHNDGNLMSVSGQIYQQLFLVIKVIHVFIPWSLEVCRSKLRLKEKMNTPTLSRSLLLISRLVTLNGASFSCSLGGIEESRHVSLMIRTNSLSWVQPWMCRINQSFLTNLLLLPFRKKMQWNFISTSWAYDLQSRLVDQQQQ